MSGLKDTVEWHAVVAIVIGVDLSIFETMFFTTRSINKRTELYLCMVALGPMLRDGDCTQGAQSSIGGYRIAFVAFSELWTHQRYLSNRVELC